MVFSKWFGGGEKEKKKPSPETMAFLKSLDPMWRDVLSTVQADPELDPAFKQDIFDLLRLGKVDEVREALRKYLPMMTEANQQRLQHAGHQPFWADEDDLEDARIIMGTNDSYPPDAIELATISIGDTGDGGLRMPLFYHGEGHLLTVAPTGAGKGQHFILRTLLDYEGPAVVLDPKGENYRETAWRRDLFGQVFKWSPFEDDSDCYNPLDFISDWDDARLLADLVIVGSGRDQFWDTAARNLLTGLIIFVKTNRPPEKQNMREVCRVLAGGPDATEEMLHALQASTDDNLVDLGNRISQQNDRLKESIYESLNAQLEVWRSKAIVATTSSTTPRFNMADIVAMDHMTAQMAATEERAPGWHSPGPGILNRGTASTVYIVIPPDKIGSYRSVLRVLLGQMLKTAMRAYDETARYAEENPDDDLPAKFPWWPMMFLMDEFPQLGYMAPIEEAISTARSYNVRLWLFAQSLAQLSKVYDNWQTIMAGCRAQIFFRPNDMETAKAISERIGTRKGIWGDQDWIASPQALMGKEFKDDCVILLPSVGPIRAQLYKALHENDELQESIAEWKDNFGTDIRRAPKPKTPLPESDQDELEAEPADQEFDEDEEYQREIAEAKKRAEDRRQAKRGDPPEPPSFD